MKPSSIAVGSLIVVPLAVLEVLRIVRQAGKSRPPAVTAKGAAQNG